jgi:ribonuclease HI
MNDDSQRSRDTAVAAGPVVVHFDGASNATRGGGLATYGFTIEGGGFDLEDSGLAVRPYSDRATNNVAEYSGAIQALERLRGLGYTGPVDVYGDSQLVIRQMSGEYEVRADHLRSYHEWLTKLARTFSHVTWHWVPREENVRADALSQQAIADHSVIAARHRPHRRGETVDPDPGGDEPPGDAPGTIPRPD